VLLAFARDGGAVGNITVAGGVVTLTAFSAGHWSELEDAVDPPMGTILDTVGALAKWEGEQRLKRAVVNKELVEIRTPMEVNEDRLPRCAVSRTPGSKAVYGVFGCRDDEGTLVVYSAGLSWIRMKAGSTPELGDLIESAGDGTGRVQSNDIIRSCTVGKIVSLAVRETYPDGSYTLPCTLYCG
jgi:hypothetical protein